MQPQRIRIKNNGPITDFEMEINGVNLLIGEQATGKSTIAKSIFFFRNIKTLIADFLIQVSETGMYKNKNLVKGSDKFYKLLNPDIKDSFINLFGYGWDLNPEFYMRYDFAPNIYIETSLEDFANSGKKYISTKFSSFLSQRIIDLMNEALDFYVTSGKTGMSLELEQGARNRNRTYIINKLSDLYCDGYSTYYIPAGRSLLTVMAGSRSAMNQAQNLDLVTERFMGLIDSIRGSFNNGIRGAYKYYPNGKSLFDVHQLAAKIIRMQKGEYYNTKSGEVLHLTEGSSDSIIKLNFMSSGQQELLWLVNFLYILMLRQEKAFVIIEEPEAHIYPTLQKDVAEFIASYVNICSGRILCTTHSPYILAAFNNLVYAGFVASKSDSCAKKVKEIISPASIISDGGLNAIKLFGRDKTPQSESLIGRDEGEISSDMIDEVSGQINSDYTKLYSVLLDASGE